MNILLFFFAIPVATIILSAIFETFINSPVKVAGIAFSIFLVTAFILGGTAELIVGAIIYTSISFITAYIVKFINKNNCSKKCNIEKTDYEVNNEYNNYKQNNFNQIPEFRFNNENFIANSIEENDKTIFNENTFNHGNNSCRRFR